MQWRETNCKRTKGVRRVKCIVHSFPVSPLFIQFPPDVVLTEATVVCSPTCTPQNYPSAGDSACKFLARSPDGTGWKFSTRKIRPACRHAVRSCHTLVKWKTLLGQHSLSLSLSLPLFLPVAICHGFALALILPSWKVSSLRSLSFPQAPTAVTSR